MENGATKKIAGRPRLDIPHVRVRTQIANGKRVLDGVDGRSLVARRYRELTAALAADALGSDLTEAQLQLVRSAAGLIILRERLDVKAVNDEPVNALQYCRITGTLRRLLVSIGLQRHARDITPSLAEYLANRPTEPAEESVADDAVDLEEEAS